MLFRHVHITEATLYKLNNEYHVEPYLSEPFQTYLIVSSEVTSQPVICLTYCYCSRTIKM